MATNNNAPRSLGNSSYIDLADKVTTLEMLNLYPEEGRTIWNVDDKHLYVYNGTEWEDLASHHDTGWGLYGNPALTQATPLTVEESSELIIPINTALIEVQLPSDVTSFVNLNTYTVYPKSNNDIINFNLSLTASSSANNGIADMIIKSGGQSFRRQRMNFTKGHSTEQGFNFTSTQYVSQQIETNGFQIYISSVTGNTSVHDVNLLITRLFKSHL